MRETLAIRYSVNSQYSPDDVARPFLPITLQSRTASATALALVDSGADINVLPYQLGLDLGADRHALPEILGMQGLTEGIAARKLLLHLKIGNLPSIRVGFAWATLEEPIPILGQVGFFSEFDVCFYRSRGRFLIELAQRAN